MKKIIIFFVGIAMLVSCNYDDTANIEKRYPKSDIIKVPDHASSGYIVRDTIKNSLRYIRTGNFSNNIIIDNEICKIEK